ncbi:DUF5320 domain-containing protein [Salinispira pacifica]
MPHGDRRGPMGGGPRSGRGFGYCSGSDRPGHMAGPRGLLNSGAGFGPGGARYGRGFGCGPLYGADRPGSGRRHRFFARGGFAAVPGEPPDREEELAGLKEEASWLGEQLSAVTNRIEELAERDR